MLQIWEAVCEFSEITHVIHKWINTSRISSFTEANKRQLILDAMSYHINSVPRLGTTVSPIQLWQNNFNSREEVMVRLSDLAASLVSHGTNQYDLELLRIEDQVRSEWEEGRYRKLIQARRNEYRYCRPVTSPSSLKRGDLVRMCRPHPAIPKLYTWIEWGVVDSIRGMDGDGPRHEPASVVVRKQGEGEHIALHFSDVKLIVNKPCQITSPHEVVNDYV